MKARCALLLALCITAQAEVKHFYRIDKDIYRGTQPRKEDWETLAHMGIKTVLDLRGGPVHKPRERRRVEAAGMRYISLRLSGIFPPKDWQVAQVLSVMEDPKYSPIFIHCWRGADRVGLAIACYRIDHDHWTNAQALAEARRQGLSPLEILMRRYIKKFDPNRLYLEAEQSAGTRASEELSSEDNVRPPGRAHGTPPRVQSH
jgi:protein tyrosine/serine phosphatase